MTPIFCTGTLAIRHALLLLLPVEFLCCLPTEAGRGRTSQITRRSKIMSESMNQSVVASYGTHDDAEEAVRRLQKAGVTMNHISIIGRDWQMREDVQGFYHPADAMKEGAK